MDANRRMILKGFTAASGLYVSGLGWRAAQAASPTGGVAGIAAPEATRLVVTTPQRDPVLAKAFRLGVRTALLPLPGQPAALPLRDLDASSFAQLGRLLDRGTPLMLVGLVDDAAGTLVLDLVRSSGGMIEQMEHHRLGTGTADTAWARSRGAQLATCRAFSDEILQAAEGQPQNYMSFRCTI